MGLFNFLKTAGSTLTKRTPLTPDEVRDVAAGMQYRAEWHCPCGANLRIRARDSRRTGPSNFVVFPENHPRAGHSQIASSQLNWNGLAEERGWGTDPVKCPACIQHMSVADYKRSRK